MKPLQKLAAEDQSEGDSKRGTGGYTPAPEDSSPVSTKQIAAAVALPKGSIRLFSRQTMSLSLILLTYLLLFFYLKQERLNVDFSCFYASSLNYLQHKNPYEMLFAFFLKVPSQTAINMNTPFFLWLFSPLTSLKYTTASLLFVVSGLLAGCLACLICLRLTSSRAFFKQYKVSWILGYLSLYATLMNSNFNQVAGLLFFLIMAGYYYYLQQKDYRAGILWGLAIAIKLFPALLILYTLKEKRYKTFLILIGCVLIAMALPAYTHGMEIYQYYWQRIQTLNWYGNSWNASFYGFLFRLFNPHTLREIQPIQQIYWSVFILCLFFYGYLLKPLKKASNHHATFGFTLIMMLFLSPLGWMYYFSLLIFPLTYCYQKLSIQGNKSGLFNLCFVLLNWPLINQHMSFVSSPMLKLTYYSIYFYALLLLSFLFYTATTMPDEPWHLHKPLDSANILPIKLSLGFGLLIVLLVLINGPQ